MKRYYTVRELAKLAGIREGKLYALIEKKKIPEVLIYREGRRVFLSEEVLELIELGREEVKK